MWEEFIDMIFVTVGSQKFQFNRLLKQVDILIEDGIIKEDVFAQIGVSDYTPKYYQYKTFLDRNEYAIKTDQCGLFLTHGGTGAIIGAVKKGKKVIAVPRLVKFGEHVDDHQLQLLEQFKGMEIIEVCQDLNKLGKLIQKVKQTEYQSYESHTDRIVASIEKFLRACY